LAAVYFNAWWCGYKDWLACKAVSAVMLWGNPVSKLKLRSSSVSEGQELPKPSGRLVRRLCWMLSLCRAVSLVMLAVISVILLKSSSRHCNLRMLPICRQKRHVGFSSPVPFNL
jgi:hypothetical protein